MHRDLKSSNVLLDTAGGVKLTDFGVAVRVKDGRDSEMHGYAHGVQGAGLLWGDTDEFERSCDPLSGEMGTYRWMAPEVTRHEGYTKSADVFSYAMLLFELLTHEIPFADRPPLQAAVAIGLQDLRPPLPPDAPRALTDLVCACWKRRPTTRPKFDGVLTQLAEASASLTFDEIKWLDASHGHPVYKPVLQASNGSMPGAVPSPLLPAPGLHDTAVSGVVGVVSAVPAQVDLPYRAPYRAQETAPTAPAADANACTSALLGTRSHSMFPAQETAPVHHETMIIEPSLSRQRSGPELKLSVGIPM
jgi:serine/threonine protein kinase